MPHRYVASSAIPGLITLQAPARLPASGDMPTRLVMLKWGDNSTAQGNFRIGPKTLAASKLWPEMGFGQVAIDFNHNTVPGHPSYRGEPAPIAAMATLSVVEGEGLVFDCIDWRPEGVANRLNYPDLSPAIARAGKGDDEVIFCHSAALARNGAVPDLHLCSADSTSDILSRLITLMADKAPPTHALKTPSVHKPGTFMVDTDLLKKMLNLPPDATDDDINKALQGLNNAGGSGSGDNPTTDDSKAPDLSALSASVNAVLKGVASLRSEFAGQISALNGRFEAKERDTILAEAAAAGRVVPKEWLPDEKGAGGLPLEQLRTLSATLPEVIPLSARTPRHVRVDSALGNSAQNSADEQVRRTLGISKEVWDKTAAA